MNTEWKEITGFDDYYISRFGKVRSKKRNRDVILKQNVSKHGYSMVSMYKDGKSHLKSVHRLVAIEFIPNNNHDKWQVNHKDGNKLNNYYSNLEWSTAKENIKHAYDIGLKNNLTLINNGKKNSIKVEQIDIVTEETIRIHDSIREASRYVDGDASHILRCCRGVKKSGYGYKWRFLDKKELRE